MIVLGVTREVHDPAAALLVDGRVVAAAEEERFVRVKHAPGRFPVRAARFCLEAAGVRPGDLHAVAWPWSDRDYRRRRWRHALRHWRRPRHALRKLLLPGRGRREERKLGEALAEIGVRLDRVPLVPVAHHLAHAASAFRFSGFPDAAVLTLDAMGEFDTTWCAEADGRGIRPLRVLTLPDSLGTFYTTVTDYLGFRPNDGEYQVMGMAAFGDPAKADLSDFLRATDGAFRVDPDHVWVPRALSWQGRLFSPRWVERFGPPREGRGLGEPWIHVAAAAQRALEEGTLALLRGTLTAPLARAGGRLCLAGGCALNVVLNARLRAEPGVREVFVQPAAHDAGGALGAAAEVAAAAGDRVEPMRTCLLGPDVTADGTRATLARLELRATEPPDIAAAAADLLAAGEPVAWVQGRMEWGPRALGARSLLAHPSAPGVREKLDSAVKDREPWRPYCPAILAERAGEILEAPCPSPFLTMNFRVRPEWRERLRHAIHVDGTARAQTVSRDENPLFHRLLSEFERRTGIPAVLNTSLNRRDEPIPATAEDALAVFFATGLRALALGPALLRKREG